MVHRTLRFFGPLGSALVALSRDFPPLFPFYVMVVPVARGRLYSHEPRFRRLHAIDC